MYTGLVYHRDCSRCTLFALSCKLLFMITRSVCRLDHALPAAEEGKPKGRGPEGGELRRRSP